MARGQRVLIADEVDNTRTTLSYCVEEVIKTNGPSHIAVAVAHNKLKRKRGVLPDDIFYFSGENLADCWNCHGTWLRMGILSGIASVRRSNALR